MVARPRDQGHNNLNPAPVRPLPASILSFVDVLTPNETEARVLAGIKPDEAMAPEKVARQLIQNGVKNVIMTLGERGALIVNSSSATHVPAISVPAVDTTGAGDAFNAGLAVALASGENIEDAVRFGVVTGGIAVTKDGVIPSLSRITQVVEFYKKSSLTTPGWLSTVAG
jgi:ribokinase